MEEIALKYGDSKRVLKENVHYDRYSTVLGFQISSYTLYVNRLLTKDVN